MNALSLTVLMAVGTGADPVDPAQWYPTRYPNTYPIAAGSTAAAPPTVLPGSTVPPGPGAVMMPAPVPPSGGGVVPYNPYNQSGPAAMPLTHAPAAPDMSALCTAPARGLFQSDRAFEGFVGPVSNAVLAKDPRSNSHARFLFINNSIPAAHPLGGGNIQVYALQFNLALTERLSIIADKDGFARLAPRDTKSEFGILNLAAGLKYTFYRNVEAQALAAVGFMYEIPSGYANVQQNHGAGAFAPFLTVGKEFRENWHALNTFGYYFPLNSSQGSSFFYNSFHIDRRVFGWLYPLAELNWFWYTSGGDRLPTAFGEGDGLLNLGTRGQAGAHLVTAAFGAKAVLSSKFTLGAVFEVPLTNRHDILNNRLTVEFIARY